MKGAIQIKFIIIIIIIIIIIKNKCIPWFYVLKWSFKQLGIKGIHPLLNE